MKHLRKAFALVLALALVMSLGITAFAEETATETVPTGTIKVENTVLDSEYGVYRIFDLVMNGSSYAYSVTKAWEDFVKTVTYTETATVADTAVVTTGMVKVGPDGYYHACDSTGTYVDTGDTAWAAAFGKSAKTWLKDHSIPAVKTLTGDGKTVSATNLPYGYYYVSTANGSLVALNTLDSTDTAEVTIGDKNVAPQLNKAIVSGKKTVAANTAAVGDTVKFQLNMVVTQGTLNHVVHDVLSKGLTRNDDVVITLTRGTPATTTTLSADTDYVVSAATETAKKEGTEFNITFLEAAGLTTNDKLTITYSAVVNKDALNHTGDDNNMTNTATLHYSTTADTGLDPLDPTSPVEPTLPSKTPEQKTVTYNFNVTVLKFTGDPNAATKLTGAKFKLRSAETDDAGFAFTATDGSNDYDLVGAKSADADVTELELNADGTLTLNGLNAGTYYLEETVAPVGYNKPVNRFKIVIKATPTASDSGVVITPSDSVTYDSTGEELPSFPVEGVVAIQNNKGNELPHTGGIGTTIFYVCGAVLMASALVLLITKKKMAAN